VAQFEVRDAEALANAEAAILEQGFEGVVLRRPDGPYVFGRVDAASQIMLKLKRRSVQIGTILQR
jgi:ATP-dependent DNA ligase